MNEKAYKKLEIWQKAHELAMLIYALTDHFEKSELYGITSQIRQSSLSVPLNIVEGHASISKNEFLNFLNIANRSLVETEYLLEVCIERKMISDDEYKRCELVRREVAVKLKYFVSAIKEKAK